MKKSRSSNVWTVGMAAGLVMAVVVGHANAEPAILIPSLTGHTVLRYHGETGEFVGVHIQRGRLFQVNGISIGPDGSLFVASGTMDEIARFDLHTGAFMDIFVLPKSGGLAVPTHWAINWPGSAADGHLYVTSGPHDTIMRFKGPIPVLPPELDPCPADALPGDPCPGPLAPPGSAILVPSFEVPGPFPANPMKPFWDDEGNLYASYLDLGILRFDSKTGDYMPGPLGDPETAEFVPLSLFGATWPGTAAFGPDGNIYVIATQNCGSVGGTIWRFAGPTPGGDCTGLTPGSPCPGPLTDPDSALFAPGGCFPFAAAIGPRGNVYAGSLFGNTVLRFAGPLPDGEDTRGPCAGLLPGSDCRGSLGTPGTAELFPPGHGGLALPYDILFVDLPPFVPCEALNDDCSAAAMLPSDQELRVALDTTCSTTDGPATVDCTRGSGQILPDLPFGLDVWYHYVAPIDGRLTLSLVDSVGCGGDDPGCAWDTMLAVYGGGPECLCPADNSALLFCNDEVMEPAIGGPSEVRMPMTAGMCYTIRVGGFGEPGATSSGNAELHLKAESCFAEPPRPAETVVAKNRFLTFAAGAVGETHAVRVTFVDLPGQHAALNGTSMWVGEPGEFSEQSGNAAPIAGFPTFVASPLECQPSFFDFGAQGDLHVYHESIVPGGVYDVQVILPDCALGAEENYSPPLTVGTGRWGDVAGAFTDGHWSLPDGSIDVVVDVVALLDKFSNRPGAPSKLRADLEPGALDFKINITEVVLALDAFGGRAFPFSPPASCSTTQSAAASTQPSQTRAADLQPFERDARMIRPSPTAASVNVRLAATSTRVTPGGTVTIHAYIEDVRDLRSYQLALDIEGTGTAQLSVEKLWIDTQRRDYAFSAAESMEAIDETGARLGALRFLGGSDLARASHLGSFTLRASERATGRFVIRLDETATHVRDSSNQAYTVLSDAVELEVSPRELRAGAKTRTEKGGR